MIHSLHKTPGMVLFDDCQSCDWLALAPEELDDDSLRFLADQAAVMWSQFDDPRTLNLSLNERRAISRLRMYARTAFKSGMTEEVAR